MLLLKLGEDTAYSRDLASAGTPVNYSLHLLDVSRTAQ